MANALFTNSKNTLMFAGGVIGVSVLIASVMGSNFTPKDNVVNEQEAEVPAQSASTAPASSTVSAAVFDSNDSGWATDDSLIDDTQGFSTDPYSEVSNIEEAPGDSVQSEENDLPGPPDKPPPPLPGDQDGADRLTIIEDTKERFPEERIIQ